MVGEVTKKLFLVRHVMQRSGVGRRVVNAQVVVQIGKGDKVIQIARGAAKFQGRIEGVVTAAVERKLGDIELRTGFGRDINNSGGAMGTVSFGNLYLVAGGAFTSPCSGKRRSVRFRFDGTYWVELSRSAADT